MKKFSLLALAAAGLLFGACSEKDVVVQENENSLIDTNGDSYVGITIQLPSAGQNVTRANDDFNNGEADEFLVKSARLLLFVGTNPTDGSTAKFFKAYDFSGLYEADNVGANAAPTTTKITSTAVAVAKIDKLTLTDGEYLYAYVVVNPNNSGFGTVAVNTEFSDFSKITADAASIGGDVYGVITGTDGLLMTNSPISATPGGSSASTGAVTTAVKLDKSAVKATAAEAKANPAGCIYIERAAAKVTLSSNLSNGTISMTQSDNSNTNLAFSVSDIGWQIINTEPIYYNTRQCEDEWLPYVTDLTGSLSSNFDDIKYRFVTKSPFAPTLPSTTGHVTAYRTYFAKDPHYTSDDPLIFALTKPVADVTATAKWNSLNGRAFVPENTFDVEHQTWRNTTQVAVRVKFNGGTGFYTLTDDASYYTRANAQIKLASNITATYDVNAWLIKACSKMASEKGIDAPEVVTGSLTVELPTEASADAGNQTYTITPSFSHGSDTYSFDDIKNLKFDDSDTKTIGQKWEDLVTASKDLFTATYYKGGYAYYNIRIQHFGEYETPWSANGAYTRQPGETINQIYGPGIEDENNITDAQISTRTNRFLGRYGVVRDNWYRLTIDAISKLGSATPINVSGDNTPDDQIEEEYYISAHVHILPWVLRNQSVKF